MGPARLAVIATLALAGSLASGAAAGTGDLDPSFGSGGVVTETFDGAGSFGAARVAVQPDGNVLVMGSVQYGGNHDDLVIVRYLADGTRDATFGTGGLVRLDFGGPSDWIPGDMLLPPDGKILVCGEVRVAGSQTTVVRFLGDGSLDTSFGAGGFVEPPYLAFAGSLALQPDDKILVTATIVHPVLGYAFGTARYDPDGAADPSFGGTGVVYTNLGANFAGDVAVQGDGKILVSGTDQDNALIVRYEADGSLDPTFGVGGVASDPAVYGAGSIEILADGRLVVLVSGWDAAVRRYHVDGSSDTSFGEGGTAAASFAPIDYAYNSGTGLVREPDGDLVVVGNGIGGDQEPYGIMARFREEGGIDHAFGFGGFTPFDGMYVLDVARQPDGKLVVGLVNGWPGDFIVMRLDGECPPSPDADGDGIGDACDACTGPALPLSAGVTMRKVALPLGDEELRLTGKAIIPGAAAIDSLQTGIRVIVEDGAGDTLVNAWVPAGPVDPIEDVGWTVNTAGTRQRYRHRSTTLAVPGGIIGVAVKVAPDTGLVAFRAKGRGTYPLGPLPLAATVVLDAPRAATGLCVHADFSGPPPAPSCALTGDAGVRCR